MATSKTYQVHSAKGTHEYDIKVTPTVSDAGHSRYSMYRSNDPSWMNKGEFVLGITDTGNELKISRPLKGHLGYDEAVELQILLKFVTAYDPLMKDGPWIISEPAKVFTTV